MGIPYDQISPRIKAMIDEQSAAMVTQSKPPGPVEAKSDNPGVDLEIPLHRAILKLCAEKGWVAMYSNPSQRTGRNLGEPDFSLYAHGGRHWLIECKTAKGKLSDEQEWMHGRLRRLGQTVHIVRSIEDFQEITGAKGGDAE